MLTYHVNKQQSPIGQVPGVLGNSFCLGSQDPPPAPPMWTSGILAEPPPPSEPDIRRQDVLFEPLYQSDQKSDQKSLTSNIPSLINFRRMKKTST